MIVVLLDLDVHLPGVGSLKEKRGLIKSAVAALRRDLGFDLLERIWARNDMPEGEAMDLAVEAQEDVRRSDGAFEVVVPPSLRAQDPDDDSLFAIAEEARAVIVSGDRHLLGMARQLPVYSPTEFRHLVMTQEGA
jgi:hypothetical protein